MPSNKEERGRLNVQRAYLLAQERSDPAYTTWCREQAKRARRCRKCRAADDPLSEHYGITPEVACNCKLCTQEGSL